MDYQTLMNRRGIEKEIRDLESEIARKETEKAAATSVLSHIPRAPGGNSDKVARLATELVFLKEELEKRNREYNETLNYIASVPDTVIRTAMRLYFLKKKSWEEVGRTVNYHESTIRRKVDKILGRNKKLPKMPN